MEYPYKPKNIREEIELLTIYINQSLGVEPYIVNPRTGKLTDGFLYLTEHSGDTYMLNKQVVNGDVFKVEFLTGMYSAEHMRWQLQEMLKKVENN